MSLPAAGAQRLAVAVLRRMLLLLARPALVLHAPQLYLLSAQWCTCQLHRRYLQDGLQQGRRVQEGLGHPAL
jgi:hypothetical protein